MIRRAARPLAALPLWLFLATAAAAQSPPPVPRDYVTDQADILPAEVEARLAAQLKQFDEETSNQVLVATFPSLPAGWTLEDFTVRTAQSWGAGEAKLDNGVVLFVFVKDREVRIEVGYGLEGALPDVTAKRIIEEQITPRFRGGDYPGGVEAGVDAIIAATKGEYKAEPRPAGGYGAGHQRLDDPPDHLRAVADVPGRRRGRAHVWAARLPARRVLPHPHGRRRLEWWWRRRRLRRWRRLFGRRRLLRRRWRLGELVDECRPTRS